MEHFENTPPQDNSLLHTNMMQLLLAEAHGESIEDFIEKHSKDFRDAIETDRELVKKFQEDPDQTLEDISKIIYH